MRQSLIAADLGANEVELAFNRVLSERYYAVIKAEPDNALAEERLRQILSDLYRWKDRARGAQR
jgi:hypothetical protein